MLSRLLAGLWRQKLSEMFLNETLKKNTTGDKLSELLDRQHNSFLALDAMANKRARSGRNGVARIFDRVKDVADLPSTPLALTATATAATGAFRRCRASCRSCNRRIRCLWRISCNEAKARLKAYAELLSGLDKAVKTTTDANLLRHLRRTGFYLLI